jgi:type IV pilus assembly protein PilM
MADRQPGVWGIDLGQCALKAVRLEIVDGQMTATAFDYVEHPKILSQPDADPDQLTREALEKLLSRNSLRGDVIAIGVPGQSGLARFVKLPPVEEKKIPDIVRFEAKQQIPFPLDEVVWDYQKIGSGAVTDGFAMETEIGLFAMKRDTVNRALQHFGDVNVEVHVVQMAPLALCNFVAYDLLKKDTAPVEAPAAEGEEGAEGPKDEDAPPPTRNDDEDDDGQKRCVVALDIGTDNSNLVVTDGDRIIWQRPIPFGGNHFTRALTKDLKLTFAKAEHLKRNATKSPDLKKILAALKPVLNDFVGEIQRSLGYFTNTHRNARVDYMVGLGNAFRLPGLQKFLSEKLQLDVRKLQKLERLSGGSVTDAPAFSQNVLSFATAYGLAVQGLNLTRLRTNLLPPEIQFDRMIRAKKPWAVSAAAALLFGTFATTAQYAFQYHAVAAASIAAALEGGKKVKDENDKNASAYNAKQAAITAKENAVRNMIAGQEERLNWMLINRFINECLPVPGQRVDGKFKPEDAASFAVAVADEKEPRKFSQSDTLILRDGKIPVQKLTDLKPGDTVTVLYNDTLTKDAKNKFWNKDAMAAYSKLLERQAAGRVGGDRPEDEGVENLIQVNIETITELYTEDLKGYFAQLQQDENGKKLTGMIDQDKKNPPDAKDKGWVIELRGYTYYHEPYQFLIDTFLYTLGTHGRKAEEPKKEDAGKPAAGAQPPPPPGGKNPPPPPKADNKNPPAPPASPPKGDKNPPPPPAKGDKNPPPTPAAPAKGPKDPGDKKAPDKKEEDKKGGDKKDGDKKEADKKDGDKKEIDPNDFETMWRNVILGRVGHAVLYGYKPGKSTEERFDLIMGSMLHSLVQSTGGGAPAAQSGGPAPATTPGQAPGKGGGRGESGGGWSSLIGSSAAPAGGGGGGGAAPAGGGGGGRPGFRGGGRGGLIPKGPGSRRPMPAGGGSAAPPPAPTPTLSAPPPLPGQAPPDMGMGGEPAVPDTIAVVKKHRTSRTEFIILFIWKEPNPSIERQVNAPR